MTAILRKHEGFVENTNLTKNQQVLKDEHKILFGCDKNGTCWYKIRKLLKDGTAKIVYENDGSIRHIDFGPGDTVAMPIGGNIVELDSIPEEVSKEMHFWMFDGEKLAPHEKNRVLYNTFIRKRVVSSITEEIGTLADMVELGMAKKSDSELLIELKKKRIKLSQLDLTKTINWKDF